MKNKQFFTLLGLFAISSTLLTLTSGCGTATSSGASTPTPNGIVYVGSSNFNDILVWGNADTVNGTVVPDRIITIDATGSIGQWNGLFVDTSADKLYVSLNDNSIAVLSGASTLNSLTSGKITPSQLIKGAATAMSGPQGLFVKNNRLYVANNGKANILVFNSTDNGNAAPIAVISPEGGSPSDIYIDSSDSLYTSTNKVVDVLITADAFFGVSAPPSTRIISVDASYSPKSIWIDETDNYIYVNNIGVHLNTFYNASSITGICSANTSHTCTLESIAFQPLNKTIFGVDFCGGSGKLIDIWENAGTTTTSTPTRTITPAGLTNPGLVGVAVDPTR